MNADHQILLDFLTLPLQTMKSENTALISSLVAKKDALIHNGKELVQSLTYLESQLDPLSGQNQHELDHLAHEIDELLQNDLVEDVITIPQGIRVFTVPINSYLGREAFCIDLLIGRHRPWFIVIRNGYRHQLDCLNGRSHDSNVEKLLASARLVEAAYLALDLIGFGDKGGEIGDSTKDNDDAYYANLSPHLAKVARPKGGR